MLLLVCMFVKFRVFVQLVYTHICYCCMDFLDGSMGKESTCNARDTGDTGVTPGLGRFPGGGNGYPLHYACLENPMDRAAWWTTVHGVTKN